MEKIDLGDRIKESLKKIYPVLNGRSDFDYELITVKCPKCGGDDHAYQYRFYGQDEWTGLDSSLTQCRDCDIRDYLQKMDIGHKQELNERLMERYWFIPKDLEKAGFKTFNRTNPVITNAVNTCIDYVKQFKTKGPDEMFNLLLMGNPGTGKSHLSVAIGRTLKAEGFKVGFLTTGKLLSLIKDTYHKGAAKTEKDIYKDISKFDLLILDDVGAEQTNKDEFSWAKSQMFEIINTRINKPTVYTTNLNDLSISDGVGERVASRLFNRCKFIDMFTDDYRKNLRIV